MEAKEKRLTERSALYPSRTWNETIDFIRKIDQVGGKQVSYATIASAYNLNSTNNNIFTGRISSAKQFGLVTAEANVIRLTDTAKKILYPTNSTEIFELQLKCFCLPPLYKKLIDRFRDKAVPSQNLLENILLNDCDISKNAKEIAAKNFLLSVEQLGLSQAGVLTLEVSKEQENQQKALDETNNQQEPNKKHEPFISQTSEVKTTNHEYFKLDIPMKNGKVAQIYLPNDAEKEDAELIWDMLSVILKRRYGIST